MSATGPVDDAASIAALAPEQRGADRGRRWLATVTAAAGFLLLRLGCFAGLGSTSRTAVR